MKVLRILKVYSKKICRSAMKVVLYNKMEKGMMMNILVDEVESKEAKASKQEMVEIVVQWKQVEEEGRKGCNT
ncbi:conserved hypothetical protein [Ricinus communis]|uniref:Uncharacterized protein n=1 Tax=Ricinus communis TaxID=3988 RepID=B9RBQ3_RICCO|nr:conserved hypothetical protein [Ricinus communis]